MAYHADWGADLGPIGENFGAACDQIDPAEVMLGRLHQQATQGLAIPGRPGRKPTILDHFPAPRDPEN
jgi:hypothetical protein